MTETDVEIRLEACNRSKPANIPMVVIENYTSPRNLQTRRQMKVSRGMVINALYKTHDWIYVRNYENLSGFVPALCLKPIGIKMESIDFTQQFPEWGHMSRFQSRSFHQNSLQQKWYDDTVGKKESQSLHRNYLRKSASSVPQTRSWSEMGRVGCRQLQDDVLGRPNFSREFYSLRIPTNRDQGSLHNFYKHVPFQHSKQNSAMQPSESRNITSRQHQSKRCHWDTHFQNRSDIHPFTKTGRYPSHTTQTNNLKRASTVHSQPLPQNHISRTDNATPHLESKFHKRIENTVQNKMQTDRRLAMYFPQDISTIGYIPTYLKSPVTSPVKNLSFSSHLSMDDSTSGLTQNKSEDLQLTVIFDYTARDENDVSVSSNEVVTLLSNDDPEWFWVRTEHGEEGFIPRTYAINLRKFNLDPRTKTTYC